MSGIKNNGLQVQQYEYDFSVDGGAVSTITLSSKANKGPIPTGAILTNGTVWVETACTSGGSATVSVGVGTDVDAVLSATAVASLTANAVLVGDGTFIPAATGLYVSSAANGAVTVSVAVAALTAGRIVVSLEYILPE